MKQQRWTDEEVDLLEEMRLNGADMPTIAEMLGRSVRSLNGLVTRREVPKVHAREVRWLEELSRGGTDREIAERLGVKPITVKTYRWRLRRLGVFTGPKKPTGGPRPGSGPKPRCPETAQISR